MSELVPEDGIRGVALRWIVTCFRCRTETVIYSATPEQRAEVIGVLGETGWAVLEVGPGKKQYGAGLLVCPACRIRAGEIVTGREHPPTVQQGLYLSPIEIEPDNDTPPPANWVKSALEGYDTEG